VIARANNLIVGRAAYETAVRLSIRGIRSSTGMGRALLRGAGRKRHDLCAMLNGTENVARKLTNRQPRLGPTTVILLGYKVYGQWY
jgi:hypothetical protein